MSGSNEQWAIIRSPERKNCGISSGSAFTDACVRTPCPPDHHAQAGFPIASKITHSVKKKRLIFSLDSLSEMVYASS
jgi:hypothetical protein